MSGLFEDTTFYINAGGRGSRLSSVVPPNEGDYGIAKAMLEIGNPRIRMIASHINRLLATGAEHIIVGAGDQRRVAEYVDKHFTQDAITVQYTEGETYGTGGDLLQAVRSRRTHIGHVILVNNVDTILDIDERNLANRHLRHNRQQPTAATIALTKLRNVPHQDAFLVNEDDRVLHTNEVSSNRLERYTAEQEAVWRGSSTGMLAIHTSFLDNLSWQPANGEYSLYRDILAETLSDGLAAYDNGSHFFMDIGTPETLAIAQQPDSPVQPYLHYGAS